MTDLPEPFARRILQQAIVEGRCADLLDCLFAGGAVTLQETGELVLVTADVIAVLAGEMDRVGEPSLSVDGRCFCEACVSRTLDVYELVGRCTNCGAEPIRMIYRAGDKAASLTCPTCGVWNAVKPGLVAESSSSKPELTLADLLERRNGRVG